MNDDAPRHARPSRAGGWRRRAGVGALAVASFVVSGAATAYWRLDSQIQPLEIEALLDEPSSGTATATADEPQDPAAGRALDLLIIGSDARDGAQVDDGVTSVLADTHILMHVSADRTRVEMVSIPRDVMVEVPECRTTSGEVIPARFDQYNSAFARGWSDGGDLESAVACDVNLFTASTGVVPDGFVLVGMAGFVEVVDAIGGVDICIPEAIDAPKADLVLAAGQQRLDGTQALGYARARVGVGDGSDTGRIDRQQHLIAAVVDELLSRNVVGDAPALYRMASAALGSLTTSPEYASIPALVGLATSLREVDPSSVTFVTTPFAAYEPDPNRLVWTAENEALWDAIREDRPVGVDDSGSGAAAETGAGDGSATPGPEGAADPVDPSSDPATDSAPSLNPVC